LRLLRATHSGKIRVIYIDPPYNTGNKDWVYNDRYVGQNDRWRHSLWLEFLYRRLTLARDLLTPDGVIMVSINDDNRSRLELLMDEVFPGRRAGSFVWRSRSGSSDARGVSLSQDHEHVLVYCNEGFGFLGDERNESLYSNPDNDVRGPWTSDNLVQSKSVKDRPEAYYAIQNPENDIWYLCDPDSPWRFATVAQPSKKAPTSDPIEAIIDERRILWPQSDGRVRFATLDDLQSAIVSGRAPKQFRIYQQLDELKILAESNTKIKRLLGYIKPLEYWVGREIGMGKPRYKRFLKDLQTEKTPLSSWLKSVREDDDDDDEGTDTAVTLEVGKTGEGTALVRKIFGHKDFAYPKPLSLLKALLSQATRQNDLVLDFFAGTATTGQAVLELNAEDGGNRRFILCSSTEATAKEPDKNICRDVCAERMRRVMAGYAGKPGLGGSFAYLQLDRVEPPDVAFEATHEHARTLLALRATHTALPPSDAPVQLIARDAAAGVDTLLAFTVDEAVIDQLAAWPSARLAVYSPRPDTVRELLTERGVEVNSYSLHEALVRGQARAKPSRRVAANSGADGSAK
jgi:adenine-specific DNA-methyltransferase